MTEVSAWTAPVRPRDLSADELHGLDGLRAALAEVVDRTQPGAVSWIWDRTLAARAGGPAPVGFVEAVAAAVGDLLAVHLPDVHWAVWPGPRGVTLGVASGARPLAPVLPFVDAQDRWDAGTRDWLDDYLARAAAHLAGAPVPPVGASAPHPAAPPAPGRDEPPLPRQHRAPDDDLPANRLAPTPAPLAPAPAADAPGTDAPEIPAATDASEASVAADAPETPAATDAQATSAATDAPEIPVAADASEAPATTDAPEAAPVPDADAAPAPIDDATPAEPLETFARDTLDHAMSVLRETGAFDGDVLVVLVGQGERRTDCCSGETQEALARAREMVRSSDAQRAALVWVERNPAGLPGPPQRFPAVVVDAWDGGAVSVRLAHRFVDDVLGTDPIGEVLAVGPAYSLR